MMAVCDDGDMTMTESSGICQYLAEKYGPTPLGVQINEPGYGEYLNWSIAVAYMNGLNVDPTCRLPSCT